MLKYLILLILAQNAFALVDYSEITPTRRAKKSTKARKGRSWFRGVNMGAGYEALKVKGQEYNLVKVKANYLTDINLYLDTSFWAGKGNGDKFGPGNLEAKLGYSLPTIGGPSSMATFDLRAGVNFSSWDSNYASGRLDQIYSLFSTKRFFNLFIGLGGEWRITGVSKIEEVTSIGNIGTYFAMAGWEISKDIKIILEGGLVTISPGKESDSGKVKYTYISPLLQLGIFSQLWVELGAAFKINDEGYNNSLAGARLFDLKGIYGNSLFTGIKYSL